MNRVFNKEQTYDFLMLVLFVVSKKNLKTIYSNHSLEKSIKHDILFNYIFYILDSTPALPWSRFGKIHIGIV